MNYLRISTERSVLFTLVSVIVIKYDIKLRFFLIFKLIDRANATSSVANVKMHAGIALD